MDSLLKNIKNTVRGIIFEIAKLLDTISNGAIRPSHVTYLSLFGHIVLSLSLASGRFAEAAMLLVVFGLMDALDGELARYQGSDSVRGMLLDATTDRIKESLIFAGLAYWFSTEANHIGVLYSVLALGASFAVSYVKAKGEVAYQQLHKSSNKEINKIFGGGIFAYEVRMFILVIGFLANEPRLAVAIVLAGSFLTLIERSVEINKKL